MEEKEDNQIIQEFKEMTNEQIIQEAEKMLKPFQGKFSSFWSSFLYDRFHQNFRLSILQNQAWTSAKRAEFGLHGKW